MVKRLILVHIVLLLCSNVFAVNDEIFSLGSSSPETLAQFLSGGNSALDDELVNEFAKIYIEEAKYEGINWDVAFVQMCLETGFLKYGGLVEDGQNNFCGLGSYNNKKGARFQTIREGVRAHVQHLKAYSTTEKLNKALLDPRFHLVERGSAKNVTELSGKWAEDPKYGKKLLSLLKKINILERGKFAMSTDFPMGFKTYKDPLEQSVSEEGRPLYETISSKIGTIAPYESTIPLNLGDGWLR